MREPIKLRSLTKGMKFLRKFLSTGGYEEFAETFFNELTADAYFLEYDTPRSGDLAPYPMYLKAK